MRLRSGFTLVTFAICLQVVAQTLPKTQPDVLVLGDDERVIGHFVRASGSSVVFKSDLLGEVTVDWAKIRELHTTGQYAVVEKNIRLDRRADTAKVPKGSFEMSNQTITMRTETGVARTIPVVNSAQVIEADVFEKHLEQTPGFTEAWNGTVTAGASIIQATQQSRAFSGGVQLVRAIPIETWLAPRNRTKIDVSAANGFVSQPNTPRVKTGISHADAEWDQYFSGYRVYGFGQVMFDHNYSQGLDLMQNYGGGIGWTTIDQPALTLDLKGSISYVKQQFQVSSENHNLVASTFTESLTRRLTRGTLLVQQVSATPTWNELNAWLAAASASFTAPVYGRLSFHIGVQGSFLNRPPTGFKKNSFQATTGLTYSLK
jgi:hypothetical protein